VLHAHKGRKIIEHDAAKIEKPFKTTMYYTTEIYEEKF